MWSTAQDINSVAMERMKFSWDESRSVWVHDEVPLVRVYPAETEDDYLQVMSGTSVIYTGPFSLSIFWSVMHTAITIAKKSVASKPLERDP